MIFNPFPQLTTDRLLLRKFRESDVDVILFLRSDRRVNKFIERPENRLTKNKSDALAFIKEINEGIENDKLVAWGITLENQSNIIGTICLWNFSKNNKYAEVGYDLDPLYHGKGIMSEALKVVSRFAFTELNMEKIEAFTHRDNGNSKVLLEKNGFSCDGNRVDQNNLSNIIYELNNPVVRNLGQITG